MRKPRNDRYGAHGYHRWSAPNDLVRDETSLQAATHKAYGARRGHPMIRTRGRAVLGAGVVALKYLLEMAEAPVAVLPAFTEAMIERFACDLRTRLVDGPVAARKPDLQTIVERIKVDDNGIQEICTGRSRFFF
jgi:hypothetical protein